jgi:beta-lactamase superfamily II metal-dependent hydrolase
MDLKIFDVEHGACALLTCDDDTRIMIDCGHNASTEWRPGTHLISQGITSIELLAVTNYDEDHVSGIADLMDNVNVKSILRNKSVSGAVLRQLKTEDGMGSGIDRLVSEIENTYTGGAPSPAPGYQGLVRTTFHNSYPTFDDENNLSVALFLKCHGRGVLFTGDLETAGWLELLKRQNFKDMLPQVDVLIASHHGRENGCCDEVFELCKPYYVVISDKGYAHDTQETVPYYRARAKGGPFRDENRHVLTTRNDGTIGFSFHSNSWGPY